MSLTNTENTQQTPELALLDSIKNLFPSIKNSNNSTQFISNINVNSKPTITEPSTTNNSSNTNLIIKIIFIIIVLLILFSIIYLITIESSNRSTYRSNYADEDFLNL